MHLVSQLGLLCTWHCTDVAYGQGRLCQGYQLLQSLSLQLVPSDKEVHLH